MAAASVLETASLPLRSPDRLPTLKILEVLRLIYAGVDAFVPLQISWADHLGEIVLTLLLYLILKGSSDELLSLYSAKFSRIACCIFFILCSCESLIHLDISERVYLTRFWLNITIVYLFLDCAAQYLNKAVNKFILILKIVIFRAF